MNTWLKAMLLSMLVMMALTITGCKEEPIKNGGEEFTKDVKVWVYDPVGDAIVTKEKTLVSNESEKTPDDVFRAYILEYTKIMAQSEDENSKEVKKAIKDMPSMKVANQGDTVELTMSEPLNNVGSGIEAYFFENLSKSMIENLEGIKGITVNVNGETYESGHLLFEMDEVITPAEGE